MSESKKAPLLPVADAPGTSKHARVRVLKVLAIAASLVLVARGFYCDLAHFFAPLSDHHGPPGMLAGSGPVAEFLGHLEVVMTDVYEQAQVAQWNYETNITDYNSKLATQAQLNMDQTFLKFVDQAKHLDTRRATPTERRQLDLLKLSSAVLKDPREAEEMSSLVSKMSGIYGSATYKGMSLEPDLTEQLMMLHDYDKLADLYMGWRDVTGPRMRDDYTRFIALANKAARQAGFRDMATHWLSGYDMEPRDVEETVEDLWAQVLPLYQELHCYTRRKLREFYGAEHFGADNLIPAHLFGNMWSQNWNGLESLVMPYPNVAAVDVTAALRSQNYTPEKMHKLGESFYKSLGFTELPKTFWTRSMLAKPKDRDAICHASAWTLNGRDDVRIKMCTAPTQEDLVTVHHEQGHLFYDLAYADQPYMFRTGANDAFHEAIGDTVALSVVVPRHLHDIGLANSADASPEATLNFQMRVALDKIAFLPFGYLVDQYRWKVSRGQIKPDRYTAAWWELVAKYQGMKPPVDRSHADKDGAFDPGAKYHVAGNVPYLRYFGAHILQFQFHRALCRVAGHQGPLHECSIFESKAAGDAFWRMLQMGASQPWQDALSELTNGVEQDMDASAIIEYFDPLIQWLREQNRGQTCEWVKPRTI